MSHFRVSTPCRLSLFGKTCAKIRAQKIWYHCVNEFYSTLTTGTAHLTTGLYKMDLTTKLMMNGELACSVSYTVCLAASLLHWSRLQKGIHDTFDENNIRKVLEYAACCEEIFSEFELINVTVCTFGLIMKEIDEISNKIEMLPHNIYINADPASRFKTNAKSRSSNAKNSRVEYYLPEFVPAVINSIDVLTHSAYYIFQELIDIYETKNIDIETSNFAKTR